MCHVCQPTIKARILGTLDPAFTRAGRAEARCGTRATRCVGRGVTARSRENPGWHSWHTWHARRERNSRNRAVVLPGKETLQALYEKVSLVRLALPNYCDLPAFFAKRRHVLTVTNNIAGELRGPILLPRLRHMGTSAAGVPMPETSMHKHDPP